MLFKNRPEWLSDVILIAVLSAVIYSASYLYKIGYAKYFGIPKDFIVVGISDLINFGFIFLGLLFIFVIHENFITGILPKKDQLVFLFLRAESYFIIFMAILFLKYPSFWSTWKYIFFLICIFILPKYLIPLIPPYRPKGYNKRLEKQFDSDSNASDKTLIGAFFDLFEDKSLKVLAIIAMILTIPYLEGKSSASLKKNFTTFMSNREYVVLIVLDNGVIASPLLRAEKMIACEYSVFEFNSTNIIQFNNEEIGPLKRECKEKE